MTIHVASLKSELLALIKEKAYRRGKFQLASGGTSEYYFDAKRVTFDARGAYLISAIILDMVQGDDFKAIGGPSVGADPMAGALAALSGSGSPYQPINTFMVRAVAKDHGIKERLAGTPLNQGDRVIVIDDVVTRGGSALSAVQAVRDKGCTVDRVIAIVDRMEGGRERLQSEGCSLASIFTCEDFGHKPPKK